MLAVFKHQTHLESLNVIPAKGPADGRVPELVAQDRWKSIMSLW